MRRGVKEKCEFAVRYAKAQDQDLFFRWRNLPWVIELGLSKQGVEKKDHEIWFSKAIQKKRCHLFVVEIYGSPKGMARYDLINHEEAEFSIYLMPEAQGKGLGPKVFFTSFSLLEKRGLRLKTLRARVLKENARSLHFFEQLGFVLEKTHPTFFLLSKKLNEN